MTGEQPGGANPNEGGGDDGQGPDGMDNLDMQAAAAQNKPDRNMKVCEVCGALQSASDKEDRLQMHLEGKLHQGYQKIRDKLMQLKDKQRYEDKRRSGYDRGGKRVRSRSRSRDRLKREEDERLAEEAKLHFYYSSNRWGASSNMPKLSSIFDQSKVKFSELVKQANLRNQGELPTLAGTVTLGKEWRYYKKEIEQIKR